MSLARVGAPSWINEYVSALQHRVLVLERLVASAVVLDAAAVLLASIIAKFLYIDLLIGPGQPLAPYLHLGMIGAVAVPLNLHMFELYRPQEFLRQKRLLTRIGMGVLLGFAFVLFVMFLLQVSVVYSRIWYLSWLALSFAGLAGCRLLLNKYARRAAERGLVNRRIVLVGSERSMASVEHELLASKSGIVIADRFAIDGDAPKESDIAQVLDDVCARGKLGHFDQIVFTVPFAQTGVVNQAIQRLAVLPIDVILVPPQSDKPMPTLKWTEVGGIAALKLVGAPLSVRQTLLKSAFDVTVSAVALVLLAPLFAAIAIAIKLDSPGPVFFRQRRHGYNHQVFRIWKFRTMRTLDDGSAIKQATRDDNRITRIGQFLRRTSLDELPQLINVVQGTMSLVGPRPHALAHNDHYSKLWDHYALRHRVKPGITGLAQVRGLRGETTDPVQMYRRARLDVRYTRNWSLESDIKIIFQTVAQVWSGRNAY